MNRESSPQGQSEQELIAGLLERDPYSCEALVRTYGGRVFALCKRVLGCEDHAKDCAQETFIKVFDSVDSFQGRSALWFWIRGIAVNVCLMKLRQQRRRREDSIDELLPSYDETGHRVALTENRCPALETEQEDIKSFVREAVNRLPDKYRIVLVLRDLEGYSTRETASLMDLQENAVKVRLHRARGALKALLEPVLSASHLLP